MGYSQATNTPIYGRKQDLQPTCRHLLTRGWISRRTGAESANGTCNFQLEALRSTTIRHHLAGLRWTENLLTVAVNQNSGTIGPSFWAVANSRTTRTILPQLTHKAKPNSPNSEIDWGNAKVKNWKSHLSRMLLNAFIHPSLPDNWAQLSRPAATN